MEEGSNWRAVVVEVGTTQKADEVQNAIVVICHAAAAGRDEAVEEWRYVDLHWYNEGFLASAVTVVTSWQCLLWFCSSTLAYIHLRVFLVLFSSSPWASGSTCSWTDLLLLLRGLELRHSVIGQHLAAMKAAAASCKTRSESSGDKGLALRFIVLYRTYGTHKYPLFKR